MIKCRRALQQTGLNTIVIAGGVSANKKLRRIFDQFMQQQNGTVFYPRQEFCTDNAATIAYTGCQRLLAGESDDLSIMVRPRWPLDQLRTIAA